MKILITGANGLIGKYVTKQLAESNHLILAADFKKKETYIQKNNLEWFFDDLANIDNYKVKIKEFNPDIVVHMAWQGIPDFSEKMSMLNLRNSINLLDFVVEETNCTRILVSGSCFEYGEKTGKVREIDDTTINSFFSWAKHSLHKYMELKCTQKKVELLWLRYFYVYGPGQRQASLIPMILDSFKNGIAPDIRNPHNKNDFIFVQDIALATNLLINYKEEIESGIYNLGSGYSTSVLEICEKAEMAITGKTESTGELKKIPKADYMDFWADISKIEKALDWKPEYTIEMGIKEMIEAL